MTPLQQRILKLLADGHFHSGEKIAHATGVSRSAVWNALAGLRSLGLAVNAVSGRGYRLAKALELLEHAKIVTAIASDTRAALGHIEVLQSVDSTNAWLLRADSEHDAVACVAEHQTAGRGRRGRQWFSPYAGNIYLSLRYRFDDGMARLAGLSLAVAVAVLRTLREMGVADLHLKWPNDIFWNDRKLGGILLEVSGETAGPCQVIIGLGLNVTMPPDAHSNVDQAWIDLESIKPGLSRNQLVGRLLHHLLEMLLEFRSSGLTPFVAEWQEADLFADRAVVLLLANGDVRGIGRGIAPDGSLRIQVGNEIRTYSFGEISVRPIGAPV